MAIILTHAANLSLIDSRSVIEAQLPSGGAFIKDNQLLIKEFIIPSQILGYCWLEFIALRPCI
jgi:hypothetical protein